jgi:predicted nucleotidyltransferase component of viral defense system
MIRTSKQLKDLIRNRSAKKKTEAHVIMRSYMMERLLERISLTSYRNKFILKGGMLVSALVGIDIRSTMDMDTTLKGLPLTIDSVEQILNEICSFPFDDGVSFEIKSISEMMEESEYGGIRVSMEALFDGVRIPMKLDISTGDIITPSEIIFEVPLMFEDRKIAIWAYNLETVLAEKLETVITRAVTNTRMRDLYDLCILQKLHAERIDPVVFQQAIAATAIKRGTSAFLKEAHKAFNEIEQSDYQQKLWHAYQTKFQYAAAIDWSEVMQSVRTIGSLAALS